MNGHRAEPLAPPAVPLMEQEYKRPMHRIRYGTA
jgi:hypothetical protein